MQNSNLLAPWTTASLRRTGFGRWRTWSTCALGCLVALKAASGLCQDSRDPLLDLLIQKGMLTEDEARKVRTEADALRTNAPPATSGSKWKLNDAFKSIELYGDARLRYENREVSDPTGAHIDLNRERAALRVGLRGDLHDDFYFGFRLDTAANPRSPWVTLGTSSSGVPFQGPFGKSTDTLNVGQLFIGWHPTGWLDVTAGKMANPLYTTAMVWDSDLAPEGVAERLQYPVGRAVFFATFGQFLYEDANPSSTSPGLFNLTSLDSTPAGLLAWQGGVEYHITDRLSAKIAPVLYNYIGVGANLNAPGSTLTPGFSGTFVGQGSTNGLTGNNQGWSGYPNGYYDGFTANQTGINDLLVLEIPWEVNLKLDKLNLRLFGDYAQNLEGGDRAQAAYAASRSAFQPGGGGVIAPIPSPQTGDTKAYQLGFAVGSRDGLGLVYGTTSKKNTWEARVYWQHIEQYALDPNLLDSDFFEGRGNLEGLYSALAYGVTDNVITTFRYGYASRINDKLGTGGSNQDIPQMNPIQQYNLLQLDLTVRF